MRYWGDVSPWVPGQVLSSLGHSAHRGLIDPLHSQPAGTGAGEVVFRGGSRVWGGHHTSWVNVYLLQLCLEWHCVQVLFFRFGTKAMESQECHNLALVCHSKRAKLDQFWINSGPIPDKFCKDSVRLRSGSEYWAPPSFLLDHQWRAMPDQSNTMTRAAAPAMLRRVCSLLVSLQYNDPH